MKRATITLTDELEAELEAYRAGQEVPPSLTSLVQVALRSFLAERRSHRSGAWAPPSAPRARDLPALLAGLPRLSEADARALARDLDRARGELQQGGLRDPWSQEPSGSRGA
jgi:hypothetical protein